MLETRILMSRQNSYLVLVVFLLALFLITAGGNSALAAQSSSPGSGTAMAQVPSALRILNPAQNATLKRDSITVRWELSAPGAAAYSSPIYRVQLDGHDTVTTNANEHTFTGLKSGQHSLVVQLVDANHVAVQGASSEIHFSVSKPVAAVKGSLQMASLHEQKPVPSGRNLPDAGGALPMMSVIGFGALLGGIVSALKAR